MLFNSLNNHIVSIPREVSALRSWKITWDWNANHNRNFAFIVENVCRFIDCYFTATPRLEHTARRSKEYFKLSWDWTKRTDFCAESDSKIGFLRDDGRVVDAKLLRVDNIDRALVIEFYDSATDQTLTLSIAYPNNRIQPPPKEKYTIFRRPRDDVLG